MSRVTIAIGLTTSLLWSMRSLSAQTPDTPGEPIGHHFFQPPDAQLRQRLGKGLDFKGFDDPRLTLEKVLDAVGDQYDVAIIMDTRAFDKLGMKNIMEARVVEKPIPRMNNATFAEVRRVILSRLPAKAQAVFFPRWDYVEITTYREAVAELRQFGQGIAEASRDLSGRLARTVVIPLDPPDDPLDLIREAAGVARAWHCFCSRVDLVAEAAQRAKPR
jgi:hypothetical protein